MIYDDFLMHLIAEGCIDEKAGEVVILDVRDMTSLTEYFVIASGRSPKHVQSICDYVNELLSEQGINPLRREGYQEGTWIIMDYNTVMLHIFCEDKRSHYDLERLWGGARKVEVTVNS